MWGTWSSPSSATAQSTPSSSVADRRQVAVTGAPSGAVIADWPVTWVDGMRKLDGDGRMELRPGEGILLGLEPGHPLWWISGDELGTRFDRTEGKRQAIYVTDSDLLVRPGLLRQRPQRKRRQHNDD